MPDPLALVIPPEIEASDAPVIDTVAVEVCEVCGARGSSVVATGYDYELITCRNRWTYVACEQCGHVWIDPRPTVDSLDVIYPPTYYAYNYQQISPVLRRGKEVLDALKMRQILKLCGRTPERYLDVGCGDGRYLEVLARRGVARPNLFGLELDEKVVAGLQERGLQAYCERVETCERFESETFDLITMFHVIEHVESPRVVVERLAEWLAPGGVLALETPNIASLDARLFRSGTWGGYHIPRHWHLFAPETLARLIQSCGLEVLATRYQTGHSFWMYSLHHTFRYRRLPRLRLAHFFDPLASVAPLIAFTGFDRVRAGLGAHTSAMLLIARKPG